MILVISGGRQNFFCEFVCFRPKKEGVKKKKSQKTCFLTKMTQIWPIVKFLHFVFFSYKTKKQLSQTLLKSFEISFGSNSHILTHN